ncbi:MAG: biotin synthase BioB [Culturomica sp.]|jgi:biotin synthase|nr:biotin synthase BioB [Culturomica sp.]
MQIEELKERVLAGGMLSREEALELSGTEDKPLLYRLAGEIREQKCGNSFDTCSIVNARSGRCSEDCRWCAQSAAFPTHIVEYDLIDEQTCLELARKNAEYGVDKFSFVTSGRSLSDRNLERLCGYAQKIKASVKLKLCASMGLLNKEQLLKLKKAGIQRYHCNLETAPAYFHSLCSTHTAEEKIRTIRAAREVGMEVCSGGIIGMGESMADRIDLALALRELEIRSIPLNILNPIPGTPLAGTPPLSDEEVLTTIALFRFIHPAAWIRFAGGRALIRHLEADAIRAGINAAIVGDLLTTTGSTVKEDIRKVTELGYTLNQDTIR